MSLQLALLGLLNEGVKSGYELVREFAYSRSVVWPAPQNEIYRELAKLEKAGEIREDEVGPRGRRRYAITPAGGERLRHWLAEEPADFTLRYEPILRAVFMTAIPPEKRLQRLQQDLPFFAEQVQVLEAAEAEKARRSEGEDPRRLGRRQALALYRALLAWTEAAVQELTARPVRTRKKGPARRQPR